MAIINRFGGGGGVDESELTATPSDVLAPLKFYGSGSDEIQTGTLSLTGTAPVGHVYQGDTFYNTDAKTKLVGGMKVASLTSFKVAAYGGKTLTFSWVNPRAAAGRPWGGAEIYYSTGSYKGRSGTKMYTGIGSTSTQGATSTLNYTMPAVNTTYYFSLFPYVNTSLGTLYGDELRATGATSAPQIITVTSTKTVSVPSGYSRVDIFAVGGGAGGSMGYTTEDSGGLSGHGGGSGYTTTLLNVSVSVGSNITCSIGSGGVGVEGLRTNGNSGIATTVSYGGRTIVTANGGQAVAWNSSGGFGGSGGGGASGWDANTGNKSSAGTGGTNGGNGNTGYVEGGQGQGKTTRAFGESSGTLYASGGSGGGISDERLNAGGAVTGGGGNGAYASITLAGSGTAGTGSGGGGGDPSYNNVTGTGGSGLVLLRFH